MAEVTNYTIEQVLYIFAQCSKWVSFLPLVNMFAGAMPQSHTSKIPYNIVHGQKLWLPIHSVIWVVDTPAVISRLMLTIVISLPAAYKANRSSQLVRK